MTHISQYIFSFKFQLKCVSLFVFIAKIFQINPLKSEMLLVTTKCHSVSNKKSKLYLLMLSNIILIINFNIKLGNFKACKCTNKIKRKYLDHVVLFFTLGTHSVFCD